MDGSPIAFFSEKMSPPDLDKLMMPGQKTAIYELEFLAILLGVKLMSGQIKGKRLVIFTDNAAVFGALQKCRSRNQSADRIIRHLCEFEEAMSIMLWLERVPSQSNPSDGLSRTVMDQMGSLSKIVFDLSSMIDELMTDPKTRSLSSGEERD